MPGRLRFALLLALALAPDGAPAATLYRGSAFGEVAEVEVLGLEPAATESAVRLAFEELAAAEGAARSLAERGAGAAGGAFALAPDELELLLRAQRFCAWSEGTVTALAGGLYRLWGLRTAVPGRPPADRLAAAVEQGRCRNLTLDPAGPSARLADGAALDLFPFESGWAVDRAVARLRSGGVGNARVAVGGVVKAFGGGPEGRGWLIRAPAGVVAPSYELRPFYLRDRAAALLAATDPPLAVPGETTTRYLDLRNGRAPSGRRLVVAVTDLAVDARALAQAMFVLGPSPGQLFLGSLSPRPSVLWLLGSAESDPVAAESNWSAVPKR